MGDDPWFNKLKKAATELSPRDGAELASETVRKNPSPDISAAAYGLLGTCLTNQQNFREAECAFYLSTVSWKRADKPKVFGAELLTMLAKLYREAGRFDKAIALLEAKRVQCESETDSAKVAVNIATALADPANSQWNLKKAVEYCQENLPFLTDDFSYEQAATDVIVFAAAEDEDLFQATELASIFSNWKARFRTSKPGTVWYGRQLWLEGLIHRRLGDFEIASTFIGEARREFESLDSPLLVALAGLDLALIELKLGRARKAAELCGQTFPVLKVLGRKTQEIVAVRTLQTALTVNEITEASIRAARRELMALP